MANFLSKPRIRAAVILAVLAAILLLEITISRYDSWYGEETAEYRHTHGSKGSVFNHGNVDETPLNDLNDAKHTVSKKKKAKSSKHGKKHKHKSHKCKNVGNKRPKVNPGGSNRAYVTWFSSDGNIHRPLEDDQYFIATRILIWQLLHNPETRTNGIDVVVMVDPTIDSRRRERLAKDGAIIYPVEFLTGTVELHPGRPTWNNIMTKLRVFEMTQYELVLVIDGDSMLLHSLDGVFDDPATRPQKTLPHEPREGFAPMPSTYVLAGLSEIFDSNHQFPPTPGDIKTPGYMNAGFFVCSPSKELFEYYRSFLLVPDERFNSEYMEQNLLRTAHGWDGPMPWKELDYKWNIREPNENDFEQGVVSVHEKFWDTPLIYDNQKVKDWLASRKWEMKGWYDAYDQLFDD
ncbi:hypothetical protein IAQ61_011899 [Plenodomus lingam]|uniref:Nucleotide-diphospho-sugar transferase n=1 Tax=Leptosphaeria maculans (strain JN3 / isolate v23.1.3 / race Av1-4-5-6-7-8) TaxID=985895 RepID=E5ABF9_LEPMJ|nr:hypothetical protein LEMA_P021300.1 [Plenodomus lingam JN3]KAH9860115.1 hypothetical protein IAQ61_011899 [Plenodomus lingam]CBY01000.1 hypothetical protein LEMA_P021300.1 [Plenodomus lingam JN3]